MADIQLGKRVWVDGGFLKYCVAVDGVQVELSHAASTEWGPNINFSWEIAGLAGDESNDISDEDLAKARLDAKQWAANNREDIKPKYEEAHRNYIARP